MKRSAQRTAISIALIAAVAAAGPAMTQEVAYGATPDQPPSPEVETEFDLPAGGLAASLEAFTAQSGIRLEYDSAQTANRLAPEVQGRMGWRTALGLLLQDSGLAYRQAGPDTVLVAGDANAQGNEPVPPQGVATRPAGATDLGTITVTGTRIRGGETPSPIIAINSERIREEGFTDLGEVIRSVPQNFSGGQNPGVLSLNVAGAGRVNNNLTGGSSLNLRGLGPDASLALLNGRRMSYGGFVQAVDISVIPVEAVERMEIVPDGASAIYGSDAVGGVANIILKREFEGLALGTRYGSATDGGLTTREYTATAGDVWSTGGIIATYKDSSVDPIYARQRDYTDHLTHPTTIYPGSDTQSALVSAHQALGSSVEIRLDALRTERDQNYNLFHTNGMNNQVRSNTTSTLVSPSLELFLPHDWTLTLAGAWARDKHLQVQSWENIQTAATSLWLRDCFCNESRMFEAGAEGPVFDLPGGEARLAVGVGHRSNKFDQLNLLTGNPIVQGEDSSRFGYAELNLPLVGEEQGIAAVQRLQVTGALRGEDYDSFGGVTTPKIGVIYGPTADFSIKASWGESFKAPTLFERNYARVTYLYRPQTVGGRGYPPTATALYVDGGSPGLAPERARTSSISVVLHPEALRDLQAELTWFDIDYVDRVVQPIGSFAQAMSNPIYADFRSMNPSDEEKAAAIAASSRFSNNLGVAYNPSDVVAIIYGQYINVAAQEIRGVDLSGSYGMDIGRGRLTTRGSFSWLDSSQKISAAQGSYDLAGTLHNPARRKGRLGMVWGQGSINASLFGNYIAGVTNPADRNHAASFTTVDAVVRFSTARTDGTWPAIDMTLSAENVFDRPPPLYTPARPAYVAPYDATNYSAIGRFLSVSLAMRW